MCVCGGGCVGVCVGACHMCITMQVAVADLVGMIMGIELARMAGSQAIYIWGAYVCLSCLDFVFILKSLDTIVFRFLNLERMTMLAHAFVRDGCDPAKVSVGVGGRWREIKKRGKGTESIDRASLACLMHYDP